MGLRTAMRQSKILTFLIMLAFVYLLLVLLDIIGSTRLLGAFSGNFVGQTPVGGLAGMLVLVVWLGVLVALFGELSESEPAPDSWPPSE